MKIRLSELRALVHESLTEHDMLFDSPRLARQLYDRFKQPEWPTLGPVLAGGRYGTVFLGPEDRVIKVFGVPKTGVARVHARLMKVAELASPNIMGLDSFGITTSPITSTNEHRPWYLGYYMGERLVPLSPEQKLEVPDFVERARNSGVEHGDVDVSEEDYRNVMSTPDGQLKFIDIEVFLRFAV